jgi:hypothetical protein
VNFCLISGLSALLVFVSFLCGILALAFYKYTTGREHMSLKDVTSRLVNDDDNDMYITTILSTTESPTTLPSSLRRTTNWDNTDSIHPLSEIDICINPNSDENNEQLFNDILTDTI